MGGCPNCDSETMVVDARLAEALAGLLAPHNRRDKSTISQYGSKALLKYQPTAAETQIGIKQQVGLVDWSSPSGMPIETTVTVGRLSNGAGGTFPTSTAAAKYAYRFYATVTLGVGAVMYEPFNIDVNRGQRFTVSASYVNVTIIASPPPTGYIAGSMLCYAGLGLGNAPSQAPVIFTQFIDGLGAGATSNIVIPPSCNYLLPLQSTNVNGVMQLDFLDNFGAIISSISFGNGQQVSPIPLEQDFYSINLTNQGAIAASYRLPFQVGT
jgi:hypothetical protein